MQEGQTGNKLSATHLVHGHISDPDVATVIHCEAVGEVEQPRPPGLLNDPLAGKFYHGGGRNRPQLSVNKFVCIRK